MLRRPNITAFIETPEQILEAIERKKQRRESQRVCVEPQTAVEKWLDEKWMQMLALDRISIHDNFFDLGADPHKAAILLDRVQQELGVRLPVVVVFDAPT